MTRHSIPLSLLDGLAILAVSASLALCICCSCWQRDNAAIISDLQARVARLDAEHPTDERMEAARSAAIARAVEEGRRDLAGAEGMVGRGR